MINYHEILRLRSNGYTQRQIALSLHCSRNTISEIYELSDAKGVSWDTHSNLSNQKIVWLSFR